MLVQDHLSLKVARIKAAGDLSIDRGGLTFVFPQGGEGCLRSVSGSLPLAAGDVAVVGSEAQQKVSALGKEDLVLQSFSLSLEHVSPLLKCEELAMFQHVSNVLKCGRLYTAASEVARECHRRLAEAPSASDLDRRCQVLGVVSAILEVEFRQVQSRRKTIERLEGRVLEVFGQLTPMEIAELSVEGLARKFSCSRRHLNRLFHQYFGYSVGGLRMEMRLLKALSLLRDPYAKIANVAEQCGFNHLGLFNICFRKRFGSSPGNWRKVTSRKVAFPSLGDLANGARGGACRSSLDGPAPGPEARRGSSQSTLFYSA